MMPRLRPLPCLDSPAMAASRRQELDIPRDVAAALGRSAVEAASQGYFVTGAHRRIEWRDAVRTARAGRVSLPPHAALPREEGVAFPETRVQVSVIDQVSLRRNEPDGTAILSGPVNGGKTAPLSEGGVIFVTSPTPPLRDVGPQAPGGVLIGTLSPDPHEPI